MQNSVLSLLRYLSTKILLTAIDKDSDKRICLAYEIIKTKIDTDFGFTFYCFFKHFIEHYFLILNFKLIDPALHFTKVILIHVHGAKF